MGKTVLIQGTYALLSDYAPVVVPQPPIPLDAYHACAFVQPHTLEIAYTNVSLFYGPCVNFLLPSMGSADPTNTLGTLDLLTFGFIIFFARKSKVPGFKVPTLLDTIAEDATRYFLVIFTSHLVFVITLNLGRVSPAI
jgi:hypothetical protein